MIGEDGVRLLAWLEGPEAPAHLARLPEVRTLRAVWQRHYRFEPAADGDDEKLPVSVRLATKGELAHNQEAIESP